MPISIPVIDMVEIGAGGGSLARVDAMRQIRVGPESAGSEPGPACYGRGGEKPAVTDADLILGKLDAENFAGGTIPLHPESSRRALDVVLGATLGMDAETAAFGLTEVVDENMANAARVHAVENGEDLSLYTMIAFGGAAPLHAGRLCEKLGIARALVPNGAGVGSAIGFLRAPFSFEANRSVYMKLSRFQPDKVRALLSELEAEATGFVRTCDAAAPIRAEFKAYMRYSGQGWEIPVLLTPEQAMAPDAGVYQKLFEADYAALFGRVVDGMDVEITVWAVNATTPKALAERLTPPADAGAAPADEKRRLFDGAMAKAVDARVIARVSLKPGQSLAGPAVITEDETTVIVPSSRTAFAEADGTLSLVRKS